MNNIMMSIKRFFKNKNTVTIIGVIVLWNTSGNSVQKMWHF